MQVSFVLEGSRGKKFRIATSQMGKDLGGGVYFELQEWVERKSGHGWVSRASACEESGTPAMRILANWLTHPMPKGSE